MTAWLQPNGGVVSRGHQRKPPHLGAVSLNAGKTVVGADATLEFSAGLQGFIDYFNGNTTAVAELCTARGKLVPRAVAAAGWLVPTERL